jgi:DNA polymerase-3 subunit gamma/tau
VESPLALYRRYRPETFAEVIGQDHVTGPLRNALANDRVNHAYLFSGPRGCGKTTSARILARALNCARAPIADPCGECDSCRDLARGGSGSIDVIEIDAASHGGVDDARDLREKAFFAPVRDRYKIYIIDEAHMVSNQGFNALLKLVEEPPPHLRFIFATTEPEKVIPTIRSRTHHYPFRLIPPRLLSDYLQQLSEAEGVTIEPAALPLVVRAGAGSARDTLSVLDQLLGGAGPEGVTHQLATGLLGFTPDTLLDEVVDAFASGDGAAVFGVVDKVIETGQDPRRFTEDLLRRLRDLVIVAAVPDAPASGLIDVAQEAGERLVAQAARFGAVELSRAADIVAAGLTEMRGATAPRLLLELLCARVLLPGADSTSDGVMARLDRLERRLEMPGGIAASPTAAGGRSMERPADPAPPARPAAAPPPTQQTAAPSAPSSAPQQSAAPPAAQRPAAPTAQPAPPEAAEAAPVPPPPGEPVPPPPAAGPYDPVPPPDLSRATAPAPVPPPDHQPPPAEAGPAPAQSAPAVQPTPAPQKPAAPASAPQGGLSLVDVRRLWPDVLEATKSRRRLAWMILTQNAQVVDADPTTLTLAFANAGALESFLGSGCDEILRAAALDVVGVQWRIETLVDPSARPADEPVLTRGPQSYPSQSAPPAAQPDAPAPDSGQAPDWAAAPAPPAPQDRPSEGGISVAREALSAIQSGAATAPEEPTRSADDDVHPDDPTVDSSGLDSTALLEQALGARVIDEIEHN